MLLLLGSFLPSLKPDFDFEKFFPVDDPDLIFYQKHLETFDYDNDYITLIAQSDSSVFKIDFLSRIDSLTDVLKGITNVESVSSPTNMRELVKSPMGTITVPAINYKDRKSLEKSSKRFIKHPIFGSFISDDQKAIIIQLKHAHIENLDKSEALLAEIEKAIAQTELQKVRIVGRVPAQKAFISLIEEDFAIFLVLALSLSLILLKVFFITWRGAIIPFLVAISTLICTLGLMALTNTPLSIVAALIPPIILFTSTSDCVHLMNAFHQINQKAGNAQLIQAIKKVFLPTLLTSITTAIGFISLIAMPIVPLREFGIFSAIGVVFAFIFTFLITPLFIKGSGNVRVIVKPHKLSVILAAKRTMILLIVIVVGISLFGISKLKTEARLLQDLPNENAVKQDFNFLDKHFGGSKPWELAISVKKNHSVWDYKVAAEINKISKFISDSLEIERLWSPTSLLNYGNQVLHDGNYNDFIFPDSSNYQRTKKLIRNIYSSIPQPKVINEQNTYARIIGFIPQIGSAQTHQMNLKLDEFIDENINKELIETKVTGTTVLIDKSHRLISSSMIQGLLSAIILVSLILGLYFKSLKLALLSLIPNLLPLLITAGIMGLFGITLNLTTSIIFAIAFGIAVDDTIHFITSYLQSNETGQKRLEKTFQLAGNGMILTTLIVLAGFVVFLFSSFGATFYLGLFLVIAMSSALVIDLTLLPFLLEKIKSKQPR
ncbi:MAG: efflux RND transporter permease subunit [Cyclobacteriaceae bacterium]